jgi:hypothetical protein
MFAAEDVPSEALPTSSMRLTEGGERACQKAPRLDLGPDPEPGRSAHGPLEADS